MAVLVLLVGVVGVVGGSSAAWGKQPAMRPPLVNLPGLAEDLSMMTRLWDFYLPDPAIVESERCRDDLEALALQQQLPQKDWWAIRLVDAWGKVTDGFLFGNVHVTGMYEECLNTYAAYNATNHTTGLPRHAQPREFAPDDEEDSELRSFWGRYCIVAYQPLEEVTTAAPGVTEVQGLPGTAPRIGIPWAILVDPLPYYYGTCMPSSCSANDLLESVNGTLAAVGREVWYVSCRPSHDDPPSPFSPPDVAMTVVLSVLAGVVLLATLLHLASLHLPPAVPALPPGLSEGRWRYVKVWSAYHNLGQLFDPNPPDDPDTITCLAGIRAVTMVWILICHQYQTSVAYVVNTVDVPRYQDPWAGQVLVNGWPAVDTFFFVGGLVLARRLLPALLSPRPVLHALTLYLRGFLRLSPSIAVVAGFSATLLGRLARGPRADSLWLSVEECRQHWWKDPLFIDNYVWGENEGLTVDDCLDHCWFTAVYMQLLWALPLMLLPFLHSCRAGLAWLVVLTVGSVVVPLVITIVHDLPPFLLATLSPEDVLNYQRRVMMAPWCRAGPWLVGVWTALALHHHQQSSGRRHHASSSRFDKRWRKNAAVVAGYALTAGVMVAVLAGPYPYNHIPPLHSYTRAEAAAYASLARPVWGLCMAYVVYTCYTNMAGPVQELLSYRALWPLARLSLAVFLVGPVVQTWWSSVQLVPVYFNYLAKLLESFGVLFLSLVMGTALACLVQLPVTSTIRLLQPPAEVLPVDKIL